MAGFFDKLVSTQRDDSDDVKYNPVGLDAGSMGIIDSTYERSKMTPDQIHQRNMQGVNEAAASMAPTAERIQGGRTSLGSEATVGSAQAIASKYKAKLGADLGRLQANDQLKSKTDSFKQSAQAMQALAMKQQVENENYKMAMKAWMANEEARAAAIGDMLGLAGTVGGAMVGGPAGAMAGNQAGHAVAPKSRASGYSTGADTSVQGNQDLYNWRGGGR